MGDACIVRRGGGTNLNFDVVGGLSQPRAKDCRIWVVTDKKISNWVISATRPDTNVDGTVWIKLSNNIFTFNALKKNNLTIGVDNCMMLSGGVWSNIDSRIYYAGRWQQYSSAMLYLYQSGVDDYQCTYATGGWKDFNRGAVDFGISKVYMWLQITSDYPSWTGGLVTANAINAQNFKKLSILVSPDSKLHSLKVSIGNTVWDVTRTGEVIFDIPRGCYGVLKVTESKGEGPGNWDSVHIMHIRLE